MNLAPQDRPWFEALLAKIDPRLHPSIRATAFRTGIGRVAWEPLFRQTTERVAEYLGERLAELPAEARLARRQDPHVLRLALEFVFSDRGATTGENYVGQVHLAMALAALGFSVRSDGHGLDNPEAFCSFVTDCPCGSIVRQMRRNAGVSIKRPQMDGLAPLARETARRLAETGASS